MKRHTDIELDEPTIRKGLASGLMRWNAKEKVYELTPMGDKWLREYCDEQIAIARMWAH